MRNETKVKFCSLRRPEDVDFVNELLPDYIGYIFSRRFKRFVEPELALEMTEKLDRRIVPVGVFVNEPQEYILNIVDDEIIRMIQLHGNESEDYILELKFKSGLAVIKYFRIESEADIEKANNSAADYVLLEGGSPGNAAAFDYSLLEGMTRPYILAGGLNPDNVKQRIELTHPYAVDTSSGVETDGVKDFEKMKRFIESCRE